MDSSFHNEKKHQGGMLCKRLDSVLLDFFIAGKGKVCFV